MDSGNSGSMQSSSGGDEEFDSRAESISAFLSSSSTNPHHQHQPPPNPTILFDPLSNYLSHHDPFSSTRPSPPQNPNNSSLLHNLDMVWPNTRTNTLRSEPNYTHFNPSLMATAASSSSPPPPPTHLQGSTSNFSPLQTHLQTNPPPPHHHHLHNTTSSSLPPDRVNSTRNSKKRSRASRRAPTTVLTTDTSNFRAMVQEFTGIPAPPFSASPFPRTRFDLFNNSSSSTMRSGLVESSPPSYLLRPFAQKFHPPSFLSSSFSSSSSPSSTSTNTVTPTTTNHNNTTNPTSPNNYQLLSELGLSNKQSPHHQNLLNIHNPSLTFQSLLQSSPLAPPSTTTTTTTTHNSQLKMGGVLEDFGMNTTTTTTSDHHNHHGRNQMGGIQNLLSTSLDPLSSMRSDNRSSWGDGVGSNNEDQDNLRASFNGNNFDNSRRVAVNGCKSTTSMNYSGSSPDFNAEKGSSAENNNNNVSTRGEGMVDSWICSSD